MSERRVFPQFREQFADTKYPFIDSATLTATAPLQRLSQNIFVDAQLYPIGSVGEVYLSAIDVQPRQISLTVSDRRRTALAFASFDPLTPPEEIYFQDVWGRPAGVLVADPDQLSQMTSWEAQTYTFPITATSFVPSCVTPVPEGGIRGIVTPAGEIFVGDVLLVGGPGVVVRSEGEDTIRIDIVGDPLFRRQLCEPINLFQPRNVIRTINGCPPDIYGNFNLTVGDHLSHDPLLRIYKTDNGLQIEAAGARSGGAANG